MRLQTPETTREGQVIDARDLSVDAESVLAAIRDETSGEPGSGSTGAAVAVDAPTPSPVHERVGYLHPEIGLRTRTALAQAARSRGLSAPQDAEIERVADELAAIEPPTVETRPVREAAAETSAETDRLRERVAELRGRIQERRERDLDTDDLESELVDAIGRLSEAETEQAAASQRLDGAAATAREARDVRERRLRMEDRRANLERAARAHLVERVEPEYADAVRAVPGRRDSDGPTGSDDPFAVDDLTAALAVARVANLSAPVVLACDRFETPAAAADWLDAPVVRV